MRDKMRYAIYCRVGSYEQLRGEGTKVVCYARSTVKKQLNRQVEALQNYCNKKGYQVIAVKKEKCKGRLRFRFGLRSALKVRDAEAIVVESMSKISRVPKIAIKLMELIYGKKKFLIAADVDKVIHAGLGNEALQKTIMRSAIKSH